MNIGTARAIFDNLEDCGPSIEEKGMAIRKVIDMETHNSVTKKQMLKAMDWMWNQIFELKQEGEPMKDNQRPQRVGCVGDTISRQAAIDALRTCYDTETISMDNGDEYINYGDAVGGIEQLSPAQPSYTDVEIQKMQDLESAQIEKAYQLGYEDGKGNR